MLISTRRSLAAARHVGPRQTAQVLRRRVWSSEVSFGLRADLTRLREGVPAGVPVRMEHVESGGSGVFLGALETAVGSEHLELQNRSLMCDAGVGDLFLARSAGGEPIYAQWLIHGGGQDAMHDLRPGLYPRLDDEEALLEGAYTFAGFRGQGAMVDGMHQLLVRARDLGLRSARTFVAAGYSPSLKGCLRLGFRLTELRHDRRRLGIRSNAFVPVEAAEKVEWAQVTGLPLTV